MILEVSWFLQLIVAVFMGIPLLGHEWYFNNDNNCDYGVWFVQCGLIRNTLVPTSSELDASQPLATITFALAVLVLIWTSGAMGVDRLETDRLFVGLLPKITVEAIIFGLGWATWGVMHNHYDDLDNHDAGKDNWFWVVALILQFAVLVMTAVGLCRPQNLRSFTKVNDY